MPLAADAAAADDAAPGALAAAAAALTIAAAYVALLYVPPFRAPPRARPLPRDHPSTILRRFAACGASCALAVALFLAVLFFHPCRRRRGLDGAWRLLGLAPPRPGPAFLAPPLLALVPYVPTGCARWLLPVSDRRRKERQERQPPTPPPPRQRPHPRPRPPLALVRDCFIAPLTEELAFRACVLPLLVPAVGTRLAPWIAPLLFSLAHAHHHLAPSARPAPAPAPAAAAATAAAPPSLAPLLLQLSYTYAFGLYASLMLVATGSLPGVVAAHALCNALGLPGVVGGATAAATALMVAALAAPRGALDAARWYGGGLWWLPDDVAQVFV